MIIRTEDYSLTLILSGDVSMEIIPSPRMCEGAIIEVKMSHLSHRIGQYSTEEKAKADIKGFWKAMCEEDNHYVFSPDIKRIK